MSRPGNARPRRRRQRRTRASPIVPFSSRMILSIMYSYLRAPPCPPTSTAARTRANAAIPATPRARARAHVMRSRNDASGSAALPRMYANSSTHLAVAARSSTWTGGEQAHTAAWRSNWSPTRTHLRRQHARLAAQKLSIVRLLQVHLDVCTAAPPGPRVTPTPPPWRGSTHPLWSRTGPGGGTRRP